MDEGQPAELDWGVGRYEATAEQLLPAAVAVVASAAPKPGERVLDLGCGTGNAALLAAAQGARVTGVDPALRLLEVGRAQATNQGLEVEFVPGHAASVPLGDASIDVVVSVFGIVFAPDPRAAAAELSRVLASDGRVVFSAWVPRGAIAEMNGVAAATVREAVGAPSGPDRFPWHDLDALTGLFGPLGFRVVAEERDLPFTAPSARAFLDHESTNHPVAIAGRAVLDRMGLTEALHDRMLRILHDGNEEPDGFRVTSQYIIATASRS